MVNPFYINILKVGFIFLFIYCEYENVYGQTINKYNKSEPINTEQIQIVKQDGRFKLSCANPENYNKILLRKNSLFLEIIDPVKYSIVKIKRINTGYILYFKDQDFYYRVTQVDKEKGINYWECMSKKGKIDSNFSFYAIEKDKLKAAHLEKEECNENQNSSLNTNTDWRGHYHLELEAINGEGKNILLKYDIIIRNLDSIEFIADNLKINIKGKLIDESTLEGELSSAVFNNRNVSLGFSPILTIEEYTDGYYIKSPLIVQGPGFDYGPYKIKKIK